MMTAAELIAFEDEMTALFKKGQIKAPLHLAGGNEDELIDIFREVRHDDWVLCSWRSHYHCLLKGVPPELVRAKIIDGRSIGLCFPQWRVLSSAIVGGIAPIAVGIAKAIKDTGRDEMVYCFIGDMTAESGIVYESMKYAQGFDLPIHWVIEDNGLSVCTDTKAVWGMNGEEFLAPSRWTHYAHKLTKPHVGIGEFVRF